MCVCVYISEYRRRIYLCIYLYIYINVCICIYIYIQMMVSICVYSMFWEEIYARMVVRMRYVMDACDRV